MTPQLSTRCLAGTVALLCSGLTAAHGQFITCQAPNFVLGQPDLVSDDADNGGISAQTLDRPTDMAIDPVSGKLFVADHDNSRILRYPNAASLTSFAAAEAVLGQPNFVSSTADNGGIGAATLDNATSLFVDAAGRLWVADTDNNRILRYDNAATKADGVPADGVLGQADFVNFTSAAGVGGMASPNDVFVDASGTLWVADSGNNRVLRFDNAAAKPNGAGADRVLGQVNFTDAAEGRAANRFDNPTAIVVSAEGTLWVADRDNQRVLRFDAVASKANGANADGVLGQENFTAEVNLTNSRYIDGPNGFAITLDGTLFIVEDDGDRVTYYLNAQSKPNFAPADGVLGQLDFVEADTGDGSGLSVSDSTGLLYDATAQQLWFADDGNNRVVRFSVPTSIAVNTAVDENDGVGVGGISLRDAIAAAAADAGSGIITFAPAVHNATIRLNSTLVITNGSVRINGRGAGMTLSGDTDNNGTPDVGILAVQGTNAVALLEDLTLDRGAALAGPGIIANAGGRVRVDACEVSSCNSLAGALAALVAGELVVRDSLVRRNTGLGGPGLAVAGSSRAKVLNSTFTENLGTSAQAGAAVALLDGVSELDLYHTTIAFNTNTGAGPGGINAITNGYLVFNSVIVANQGNGFSFDTDILGSVTVQGGFNIVASGSPLSAFDDFGFQDVLPLADNGGPRHTLALKTDSIGRDFGLPTIPFQQDLAYDARGPGFPRVAGSAPDAGAFELAGQLVVIESGTTLTNGATVQFGSTPLGTTVPRTLVLSNAGAATLDFDPFGTPGGFSLMGPVPAQLGSGASATLELQLDAEVVGPTNGLFVIPNDGLSNPFELTLSGDVTPVGGSTGGTSAGATTAGSTSAGSTTAGSTSAGSTSAGTTTAGTSSGSTTAGGVTAGGTGSGGGTNAVEILDWTIELKRPKEGKTVTFVAGKKGLGTLKGIVSETGLDPKTEGVQVQFALVPVGVTNTGSVAAVTFEDVSKVGKVKKSGKIKFSAKKIGADLDLESGDEIQLWIRATEPDADFAVKTTKTNTFEFEVK